MEMDGDGPREEMEEKIIQIVECMLKSLILMKDTLREIPRYTNRMGIRTKGQFRPEGGLNLFVIYQAVKLPCCYTCYSQDWRALPSGGVRLLVYIKAFSKSAFVWTCALETLISGKSYIFSFLEPWEWDSTSRDLLHNQYFLGAEKDGLHSRKQYFFGKIMACSLSPKNISALCRTKMKLMEMW